MRALLLRFILPCGLLIVAGALLYSRAVLSLRFYGEPFERLNARTELEMPSDQMLPQVPLRMYPDPDCWCWTEIARQYLEGKTWRLRWVTYDNGPYGRPCNWAVLYGWLLAGAAAVRLRMGGSIDDAIGWAGDWLNLILLAALASGLFFAASRILRSRLLGACLVLTLGGSTVVVNAFAAGRPDHQSLHALFSCGMAFSMLLAASTESERCKRHWAALSGIFGAAGLWVGATVQAMVIGAFGLGGLIAVLTASATGVANPVPSRNWRTWGRVGAFVSLGFYFLEYLPGFPMRLEVNNPLYSLAWLAGAELLALISAGTEQRNWRKLTPWIALSLAGLAVLPCAILFGPPDWYSLRSRTLLAFYQMGGVGELMTWLRSRYWNWSNCFSDFGGLWLLFGVSIAGALGGVVRRKSVEGLLFAVPAAVLFVAGLVQVRWLEPFIGLLLPAAIVALKQRRTGTRTALGVAVCALSILSWQVASRTVEKFLQSGQYMPDTVHTVAMEYVASVLPDPGEASAIMNFAPADWVLCDNGWQIVGSGYWENVDGLEAATRFFTAQKDEDALAILKRRGIHYVVVYSNPVSTRAMLQIAFPDMPPSDMEQTLIARIGNGEAPKWMHPVTLPKVDPIRRTGLRLYEVRFEEDRAKPSLNP